MPRAFNTCRGGRDRAPHSPKRWGALQGPDLARILTVKVPGLFSVQCLLRKTYRMEENKGDKAIPVGGEFSLRPCPGRSASCPDSYLGVPTPVPVKVTLFGDGIHADR